VLVEFIPRLLGIGRRQQLIGFFNLHLQDTGSDIRGLTRARIRATEN
jgi:hypothetical protein